MSDDSPEGPAEPAKLETDVLAELGDERLGEIADALGTDRGAAEDVVRTAVSALSGGLQEKAAGPPEDADEVRQALDESAEAAESAEQAGEAPLQGVATLGGLGGGLGGLLGGGMMAGVLAKVSKPVATAVAKKTGLPVPAVMRAIELLIPVLLAVLSKRSKSAKAGPAASGGSSPDLGDLLGSVLGKRPK
ncbi:DUF937 domain-containing protein [Streptomyces triticagri]|uniref:DUF937 domain-containing protein n=1 Tax=Streptomyces triticagri TaxID=2293568 RepID=A0A372M531_9ACTN|nr:DUF937 domain-containing protein [Streptomyces triticagri]RFU85563.1 DUF937 domain-containing protein [Streptomyces triticagri]